MPGSAVISNKCFANEDDMEMQHSARIQSIVDLQQEDKRVLAILIRPKQLASNVAHEFYNVAENGGANGHRRKQRVPPRNTNPMVV